MTQPISTAQPFTTLPTTSDTLFKKLGAYCIGWEQMVLNSMKRILGDEYHGGSYEVREYLNGAFALVLPDVGSKKIVRFGHSQETMTLEAASFFSNLTAFTNCNAIAYERNDFEGNQAMHDYYHALKDVVSGRYNFVIDVGAPDGVRPLNEEELAKVQAEGTPHPERASILSMID